MMLQTVAPAAPVCQNGIAALPAWAILLIGVGLMVVAAVLRIVTPKRANDSFIVDFVSIIFLIVGALALLHVFFGGVLD